MRKILIATDGSGAAREVLEAGLDLAAKQEAEVTTLEVVSSDEGGARRAAAEIVAAGDAIQADLIVVGSSGYIWRAVLDRAERPVLIVGKGRFGRLSAV
jgi:nucleotide-binding universal stress UspA family protein